MADREVHFQTVSIGLRIGITCLLVHEFSELRAFSEPARELAYLIH